MVKLLCALLVHGVLGLATYLIVLVSDVSLFGAIIVGMATHRGWSELERYVVKRRGNDD